MKKRAVLPGARECVEVVLSTSIRIPADQPDSYSGRRRADRPSRQTAPTDRRADRLTAPTDRPADRRPSRPTAEPTDPRAAELTECKIELEEETFPPLRQAGESSSSNLTRAYVAPKGHLSQDHPRRSKMMDMLDSHASRWRSTPMLSLGVKILFPINRS